jgi:hypothetical protein
VGSWLRYLGSAVGFGFGVVWMAVGFGSAIVCLLMAALGYGAVFVAERARAEAGKHGSSIQTPEEMDLPLVPEGVELDDERAPELHDDATTPLAAEAEYGWPWPKTYDAAR